MKNNDYDHGCLRKANIRDFCFFPGIALIILGRENGGFALEINQKIWYSVRVCKRKKETVQSNVFARLAGVGEAYTRYTALIRKIVRRNEEKRYGSGFEGKPQEN
ncbi:MAG: hypothetical protein MR316_01245 [Lachnospiraceae bacterium]|nr:hypothetical protein [Lachnospiraceae bacterium]